MAFLRGYFDESGKYATHKVVSFCGFVDAEWQPFERDWNRLLHTYRLSALHLSKDKMKATNRQLQMYREFIKIIRYTVERGFACAVDVPSFQSLHKAVRSELGGDPHYLAFSTVLLDLVKYTSLQRRDPTIALICDDDQEKACQSYRFYMRAKQRDRKSTKILTSIAFADDEHHCQLQAADLLSWVTRAEALHRYHQQDYSLRELFDEFSKPDSGTRLKINSPFWDQSSLAEFERGLLVRLKKRG